MIEIILTDEKDFINSYKHFENNETDRIIQYVRQGLTEKETKVIKIKKWLDKP